MRRVAGWDRISLATIFIDIYYQSLFNSCELEIAMKICRISNNFSYTYHYHQCQEDTVIVQWVCKVKPTGKNDTYRTFSELWIVLKIQIFSQPFWLILCNYSEKDIPNAVGMIALLKKLIYLKQLVFLLLMSSLLMKLIFIQEAWHSGL